MSKKRNNQEQTASDPKEKGAEEMAAAAEEQEQEQEQAASDPKENTPEDEAQDLPPAEIAALSGTKEDTRRISNFELHSRLRFLAQDFRALKNRDVMRAKLKDLLEKI